MLAGGLTAGCSSNGGGADQYTPTTEATTTTRPDAYRIENFEQSVSRVGPRGSYVIDTTRWRKWEIPDDVAIKKVENVESGPAKEILREAILDESHGMDEQPPQRLLDLLETYDFFYLPRENLPFPYYELQLFRLPGGTPELSFEVSPAKRTLTHEDPVPFELVLSNPSDRPRQLHAGAVPPFGVVSGFRNDSWQVVLWREEYEESPYVIVHDSYVRARAKRVLPTIEPGETMRGTYQLRTGRPNFGPGRFEFTGRVKHGTVDTGPDVFLDYAFSFDLAPE